MAEEGPSTKKLKLNQDRQFLNLKYKNRTAELDIQGLRRITQLQDAIKARFESLLGRFDAINIRLFDMNKNPITDLDDIPDEYFLKEKQGGLFLRVLLPFEDADDYETPLHNISLDRPHLKRQHLIDKMVRLLKTRPILLLDSPAASGKSSLLKLFAIHSGWDCVVVTCNPAIHKTGFDMLKEKTQVDLVKGNFPWSDGEVHVILIDEAHKRYNEPEFWAALIKEVPT